MGDRDGGAAVVPGSPEKSQLFARITSDDPDLRMPPADSGKELTPEQIAILRRWIAAGAPWQDHWAYQSPRRPPLPELPTDLQTSNPIDAFIRAELVKANGLRPAPPADKATLLRRLSFDLTGLPPTPEELDAILADDAPGAYERQVDRLLQSPHYGERWGRVWLDAARYADSDGFEKDKPRFVWMYRDWVVRALNEDLPYDQFVIQQIAGDELLKHRLATGETVSEAARQDMLVATGFLRNSMINEEGGIDPEQFRMEAMFDRMDAIGKSIVGLTVQCAQCHNHKYDPLTQREYYQMFAYLNNSHESNIVVYPAEQLRQRVDVLDQIAAIETSLKEARPDWRTAITEWAASERGRLIAWETAELENAGDNSQRYYLQPDGSILALGYAPTRFDGEFHATTKLRRIGAFRLELLPDPNLPAGGPGRSIDGLMGLTEFWIDVPKEAGSDEKTRVKFVRAIADYGNDELTLGPLYADHNGVSRRTGPVEFAIDNDYESGWGIDAGPGRRNVARQAVFVPEQTVELVEGTRFLVILSQHHGGWNSDDNQNMNIGRFRLSVSEQVPQGDSLLPVAIESIVRRDSATWSQAEWEKLFSHWRTTIGDWQPQNEQIELLWKQHPAGTTQLVLNERAQPRETHRLVRGDFLKPDEKVTPATPEFLHARPNTELPPRLSFAQWLVDRRSPTAARAIVNRIWQTYFGTGLVGTSEDLGMQGDAPTHPQLLDWLAVELMDNRWSLKSLHRQIVLSESYRQSSALSEAMLAVDPFNRLISRGPRLRLEAELVRDAALAASGLLNRAVGGPSVYPPAPEFLFLPPVSYGPKPWPTAEGADRYRRAIYTFRFRSVLYPALEAFDAPNGDFACVRRSRSNTPLQALTTLNEPLFMECAQTLARQCVEQADGDVSRGIQFAVRRCLGRLPSSLEATRLSQFYETTHHELAQEGQAEEAKRLAGIEEGPQCVLPADFSTAELAAWTALCRVVMNLDEFITKE
jgi:hypothetical protein